MEPTSVSKTTAIAATGTGSFVTAKWLFACIAAGHIIAPDDGTLAVICAAIMPLGHMAAEGVLAWLSRKTGVPISTEVKS